MNIVVKPVAHDVIAYLTTEEAARADSDIAFRANVNDQVNDAFMTSGLQCADLVAVYPSGRIVNTSDWTDYEGEEA